MARKYIVVERMTTDLYGVVGFLDADNDERARKLFTEQWPNRMFLSMYKLVPERETESI